jgi:threonine synthase
MMTSVTDANVHVLAIDGTFDDCQALVKGMFNDHAFRDRTMLSGVNSINWGRIMAQIVYYFSSAISLGAPDRTVSFTVPTGNFGDIFAGYAAKRLGLPVDRLVIATNDNDILTRTLETGAYETRGVVPTTSPSMDIQVSSNFERLLFEAAGRDAAAVRGYMDRLKQSGAFTIAADHLAAIRAEFDAGRSTVEETAATIKRILSHNSYLLDPHSAIGVQVAGTVAGSSPMVVLATAHPAKFPDAVKSATGISPALPDWLSDLMSRRENYKVLPSDLKMIEDYVSARSRAAAERV